MNDYTAIPIQKFTLRKKAESLISRRDRKTETVEPMRQSNEMQNKIDQLQIAENIDRVTEKAKNIVGGVFKLFK